MEANRWQRFIGYLAHCLLAAIFVGLGRLSLRDAVKVWIGKAQISERDITR